MHFLRSSSPDGTFRSPFTAGKTPSISFTDCRERPLPCLLRSLEGKFPCSFALPFNHTYILAFFSAIQQHLAKLRFSNLNAHKEWQQQTQIRSPLLSIHPLKPSSASRTYRHPFWLLRLLSRRQSQVMLLHSHPCGSGTPFYYQTSISRPSAITC